MYEFKVVLMPEFATEVHDLTLITPEAHHYDTIKAQLIKRTLSSEQRCLQHCSTVKRSETRSSPTSSTAFNNSWGTHMNISPPFLWELFLQ